VNATLAKALLIDAFHQVLDNKVFRILAAFDLLFVLFTFVVGFGEDGFSLLFGWKSVEYDAVLDWFGSPVDPGIDVQQAVIQVLQEVLVDFIAGTFGMTLAIAATSFFVPRMLEKGAADALFVKPLGRLTLLASRYCVGLLFVVLLALFLVFGMHAGFVLVSGYDDAGFLWSALTLTYTFALVYSLSILIGIVTRSTLASVLLTLLFFVFNGCIQNGWVIKEYNVNSERLAALGETVDGDEDGDEGPTKLVRGLMITLDVLHYALPKTSDADYLTLKLRRALQYEAPAWDDPESDFAVQAPPEGLVEESGRTEALAAWIPPGFEPQELVYAAATPPGSAGGLPRSYALWCAPRASARERLKPEDGSRMRDSIADFALAIHERVLADPAATDASKFQSDVRNVRCYALEHTRGVSDSDSGSGTSEPVAARVRSVVFVVGPRLYVLVLAEPVVRAAPPDQDGQDGQDGQDDRNDQPRVAPDARYAGWDVFDRSVRFEEERGALLEAHEAWYERELGLRAPLRYNIFLSIGSSVAFAGMMFLLAYGKLRKIDF
jgi:ABC-type transport system involved in multi-copper enzyme maturation permease subunit